jgi:hypothetical protein
MLSKKPLKTILISLLILITVFTRYIKLDWGNGYYFHPDENNITSVASSLTLPIKNLNFFAKGTFSYGNLISNLIFFVNLVREKYFINFFSIDKFSFITLLIRFISASSSIFTVYFIYKVCVKFWNYKIALVSSYLVALSQGLIQAAHFGTFESSLTCISVICFYYCLKIYKKPTQKYLLINTFFVAIATALKINSVLILPIVFLIYFFNKKNRKNKINRVINIILASLFFILNVFILSPYYLTSSFMSMFNYEQQIVTGNLVVFYTRQFINSIPIVFTFLKVFPWLTNPLIILILPFILILSIFKPFKNRNILILFILILFLPNAFFFTKWSRYMIQVIPFIIIFCVIFIDTYFNKIRNILFILLIFSSFCFSLKFITIYLKPDIRIQASEWIIQNIPVNTKILSEGGNVIDLPIGSHTFKVNNFDFYSLDNNPNSINSLSLALKNSDYIIIPSRRVFKNQINHYFPISSNYYKNLFSGSLGFKKIKEFKPQNDLLFDSENGEETLTVFDRPTIRIYQKVNELSLLDYEKLL